MDVDDQKSLKAVPRFGSFRPHLLPTPVPRPIEASRSDGKSPSSPHHGVSKSRHQSSKPLKSLSDHHTPPKPEHGFVPWNDSSILFEVDVKGDARNIEYRSSYNTPLYSQPWHDTALGLKTSRASGVHRASISDHAKTSLSKQIRSDLRASKPWRINPVASSDLQDEAGADYVPLQLSKRRKLSLEKHAIDQSPPQSPKSLHHDLLGNGPESASRLEAIIEDASDQSTLEEEGIRTPKLREDLQRKKVALSRRVDEAPSDWHAWIALVELQDEIDGFSGALSQRPHTNAERQSNAEIALSMYGKALRGVTDPEGRERLHLGMMSKAEILWEARKLSSHWQNIIKQHSLSLPVWKRYLNFHQSTLSGFTLEENKARYIDCLRLLQKIRNGMDLSDAKQLAVYGIQIHVLLRLTLLLREAGYMEVAVASWQALLEFEFNKPTQYRHADQTKSTFDDSILAFEQFWDSEAPRIGEANARGWLNFDDDCPEQRQPPEAGKTPSHHVTNVFKSWADAEQQTSSRSHLPNRDIDEPLDDPYRTVLFSDVRHALIESPTDIAEDQVHTWYGDQFIRNEMLYGRTVSSGNHGCATADCHDPHRKPSKPSIEATDTSRPNVFAFHMGDFEISSDTLFAVPSQWFSAFGSETEPIPKDFILRMLNLLTSQGVGGDGLAEYLLAFEEYVSSSTVRKSAKSLLKNRPSSLRLYNAYAWIEHRHGNTEAANRVWDTAIKMCAKFDDSARRDAILLRRSRVWQRFSSGETSKALQDLAMYGFEGTDGTLAANGESSDETTNAVRLRLRNAFSGGRDHMLSLGLSTHASLYSELLFLSDYLLDTTTIQAARISFTSNLQLLTKTTNPKTRRAEALFRQSFARLLYIHTTAKRPISPSTIRSFLTECIAAFPHNTIFLSLYAWNESRFRMDDRVRGVMRDLVLSNHQNKNKDETDHITTHFFAIHADIQRGTVQGSNLNAVRGSFERALAHPGAAHSAGLWKWYFLYELENGDLSTKGARDVYYRAIRACPWAKGIWMLAFEYLSGVMEEAELRGLYEMMVEKELRIHVPLEGIS
ncbi:MAG: hypothetical protein Q9215_000554 [Flavoplaca cf. flavocitrina]